MKVIKPRYTYEYLESIKKKSSEESNDNILNKYVVIANLFGLVLVGIMIILMMLWVEVRNYTFNGIESFLLLFITEKYLHILPILPILSYLIFLIFSFIYFYVLWECCGRCWSCTRKYFIKKGKIIEDKLDKTRFFIYMRHIKKLEEIENFNNIYIVEKDKGLEVVSNKNGFIRKIDILFLNELKSKIIKEDCLDFSVIDNEIDRILEQEGYVDFIMKMSDEKVTF